MRAAILAGSALSLILWAGCERASRPRTRASVDAGAALDAREARTVTLWFAGDVHAGRSLRRLLDGDETLLRALSTQHGFVNLEGPVLRDAGVATEARLVSDATTLSAIARAGVRVASIANNHALDEGPSGLEQTASNVSAAGIVAVREGALSVTEPAPGMRVAWVAAELAREGQRSLRPLFAAARRAAPFRVISLHVTAPPLYTPPPRPLREAVRDAVAEEATVVVAHGTHTVAPITREGSTLVAWGLGNVVFDCVCSRETEGIILRVTLDSRSMVAAEVIPIEGGLDGRPAIIGGAEGASLSLLRALGVPLQVEGLVGRLVFEARPGPP